MKRSILTLTLIAVFILSGIYSCSKFENTPYQIDKPKMTENLNSINLSKLLANEQNTDDTVTILFTGDSQRFYDELDDLVKVANGIPNIDFLLLAGDISDFGLLEEFMWIYERLEKLPFPYICVMGNHDLIARGSEVYTKMFGEKNFSFTYKRYKFLIHDTNSREYNFSGNVPDLNWLSGQLND